MEAIEVKLVVGGEGDELSAEGQLIMYRLSITIGPGRDDINVESVIGELRSILSKWALTWLLLDRAVKLEEK